MIDKSKIPVCIEAAIDQSIKHWQRMIEWAKERDGKIEDEHPDSFLMAVEIGENWQGDTCPLCAFIFRRDPHGKCVAGGCDNCPLAQKQGYCSQQTDMSPRKNNAWLLVSHAHTWGGWLAYAAVMLEQLQSLKASGSQ